MYEINQEVFLRHAKQDHPRLLKASEEARLLKSVTPRRPEFSDTVTLVLGNWLVNLGNSLKSRSIYTRLSEKHA